MTLLSDIIKQHKPQEIFNFAEVEIKSIENDTRCVSPGSLFVAIAGENFNGHDHLKLMCEKGAAAIVIERDCDLSGVTVPVIKVDSSFEFLKTIAAWFYDNPSNKLTLTGITGTNGKTTTSFFTKSVLAQKYCRCGLIGTIKYITGKNEVPAPNTSPEPLFFQKLLNEMVNSGLKTAVMEVSSHAIKLGRIDNTEFDYLVFTNLSKEHTEFHPDMQDYYDTKASIFKKIAGQSMFFKKKPKYAIINIDDNYGQKLYNELKTMSIKPFTFSIRPEEAEERKISADLYAADIKLNFDGASFKMHYGAFSIDIALKMTGIFNVYNALAAAAVGLCDGLSLDEIKCGLEALKGVSGRFQKVDFNASFSVYIDYAHTPEGLLNVLSFAKKMKHNRIITVFGCGGDRSKEKRPLMGYNVSTNSDLTIVTSDNPRTEDPKSIIDDIIPGVENGQGRFFVEIDREKAIQKAIDEAADGDIVIIAGKGHENYQIIGNKKIHFDDYETAMKFLKQKRKNCVENF